MFTGILGAVVLMEGIIFGICVERAEDFAQMKSKLIFVQVVLRPRSYSNGILE